MDGVIENTSTDMIIMIDKLCKRILGHPEVLGRIMKGFIKEAKNLSIEEIMELIKGKKNIEHVRNLMNELPCSMQRAMDILKLTTYEKKKLKNIFIHKRTCKLHVLLFINQYFSIKLRIFSHFTIDFFNPIFF